MTDRNQRAVSEFERRQQLTKAQEQFARAAQTGQAAVFDSVGCRIESGQLVVFNPPPNVWRWLVAEVRPMLQPNVPPGMMQVTLQVVVPMQIPAGQKIGNLLVVGEQEQPQAQAAEAPHPQDETMQPVVEDDPDHPAYIDPLTAPDATGHSDD